MFLILRSNLNIVQEKKSAEPEFNRNLLRSSVEELELFFTSMNCLK